MGPPGAAPALAMGIRRAKNCAPSLSVAGILKHMSHASHPLELDLFADPVELAQRLVDIPSPSHHEQEIADAIQHALRAIPGVETQRISNTVFAHTEHGHSERVILAGHIDTVPIADNLPASRSDIDGEEHLWGCGSVDMKSGLAVYLHTFASLANDPSLSKDLTIVCYEGEEVASQYNGLGFIQREQPDWLRGDVALLGEPSGAKIEAGCQGSIRMRVTAHGVRAHSARSWLGDNAAHHLAPVLSRIASFEAQEIEVDGCLYREGLNVVGMEAGVASNTIPDEAWMDVNYRFAPHRSVEEAMAMLFDALGLPENFSYEIVDAVPGARPGLDRPAVQQLVAATGGAVQAKYGWTDVARFSSLGIPAVNFGPGDPALCHKKDERCPTRMIREVARTLRTYLVA